VILRKCLLILFSLVVLLSPLYTAAQSDPATEPTRAVGFSGGGWSTHTASSGWLSGLLAAGQQGLVPSSSLHSIFANQDLLAGNSGGSWFLTMLAYSPAFVSSLDAAPDVGEWFGDDGYMGAQVKRFEALSPKARTNLIQLLQAQCPASVPAWFCEDLSIAIVDVIFEYLIFELDDGIWAPGLVFLASLWDGDLNQGPTWEEAVQIVFDWQGLNDEFRGTKFQHPGRAPSLDDQEIVVAGALGTSMEVLNAAGSEHLWLDTNTLSVDPGNAEQPPIEGPIPIVFVDPGELVETPSPFVAHLLPSGPKALRYHSDLSGTELSTQLPAEVNLDEISIFDVAMVSSAAAAAMASETLTLEVIRQIIEQATTRLNSTPEGLDSQQVGTSLFAGLSVFMKRAAIGATVDQDNRLRIGDIDPQADIWQLSEQRALRLYDGGYVDNLAAAYVLKQIQVAHNPDDFVLTLFANSGGMGEAEATAEMLAQIGDARGEVLPLPSDLLNLFGRPDYLNPGTTAPLSMFGVNLTTSSPAVFDARAWKDVAPNWLYQPNDDFRLSYYRLEVETIENPHFQIDGGHQGVLHVFINQDANTSAAPFSIDMIEQYRHLFSSTRQAVLEEGYHYLAAALDLDQDHLIGISVPAVQQFQWLYLANYGRAADPSGLDYWMSLLANTNGIWDDQLLNAFIDSTEYRERTAGLTDEALIDRLYRRLFNRSADAAGRAFYADLLNGSNISGLNPEGLRSSFARIALDIANGAQVGTADQLTLANKTGVLIYFTDSLRRTGHEYGDSDINEAIAIIDAVGLGVETVIEAQARIDAFISL